VDLWFSLRFIDIPLSTFVLDGFDIIAVELVVIIDATVDAVGLSVDVVGLTVDAVDLSVEVVGLTVDVVGLFVDVNAIDMKMDKQ
jgi:hypothetical protein